MVVVAVRDGPGELLDATDRGDGTPRTTPAEMAGLIATGQIAVGRAGHGVAVLLKIYAHCIDGQAATANQRIADALSTPEAEQDSGDEGDADSEPAT